MSALAPPEGLLTAPAYVSLPASRVGSMVDVVADFALLGGRTLDAEQRYAIDALTSIDSTGMWAAPTGCVIEPRQNGKSAGILAPIVLAELFDRDRPDRIVWTAHRFKTSRDAFTDIRSMCESNPDLRRQIKKYSQAHGEEAIHLHSGASLEFLARSKMQGRGLGGKIVVLDEGFALSQGTLSALLPTLSARVNPLVLIASSACMTDSLELYDIVQAGRTGVEPGLSYVEWCSDIGPTDCRVIGCMHVRDTPGCALDDRDRWRQANPGIRRGRLTERFVETVERRRLSPTEFMRERLGVHDRPEETAVPPIDMVAWATQTDPTSEPVGPVIFAVEIPPSRACASIAVAGRRTDGTMHVGLVERQRGVEWVLDRLLRLIERHSTLTIARGPMGKPLFCEGVVLDPQSPAATLIEPLRQALVEPVLMTTREVGAACASLQDAVAQGTVWHRDAPDVDNALANAIKRDIGEGQWAFGRRKSAAVSVDVDPIISVANALWCLTLVEDYDVEASVF